MRLRLSFYFILLYNCCFGQDEIWNKLLISEQARTNFSITNMVIDKLNNKYIVNFVEDIDELEDTTILYLHKYNEFDKLIWRKKLIESNNLQSIPFAVNVEDIYI